MPTRGVLASAAVALLSSMMFVLQCNAFTGGTSSQGGMYYDASGRGPRYGARVIGPYGRIVGAQTTVGWGGVGSQRIYPVVPAVRYGYGRRVYGGRGLLQTHTRVSGVARRLLQQTTSGGAAGDTVTAEDNQALAPTPSQNEDTSDCKTLLKLIEERDDLSLLLDVINDIPELRQTFDDPTITDTFLAPSNAAILDLVEWGGFTDTEKGLKVMLGKGNATVETIFIAYHAIPNQRLVAQELEDGQLLDTALGPGWRLKVMPRDETGGALVFTGIGSRAQAQEPGLPACNGALFILDRVLLPLDGDGVLTEEQRRHVEDIQGGPFGDDAASPAAAPAASMMDEAGPP